MSLTPTLLEGFDYRVDCDHFLLYELGRLIEEDRASFEDEEFRRIIDEGIHEHVETRLDVRAELAALIRTSSLRMNDKTKTVVMRVLGAIEDTEFPLTNVGAVIASFTGYMFRRIEECGDKNSEQNEVTRLADLLFDSLENPGAAENALNGLGAIRSSVSARVLAHAVSEPMLDEGLEIKAYRLVRALWPLPRHYILYNLRPHSHEDLPYRWFQLLIDSDDSEGVDRILEEVVVHAGDPDFGEDLVALLELLRIARDRQTEEKILQLINTPETPRAAAELLEGFVKTYRPPALSSDPSLWARASQLSAANKKYLAAARLFDAGRKDEAQRKLNELLRDEPDYPFALMLMKMVVTRGEDRELR